MRLTDTINTTAGGLSEGILWDFQKEKIATRLLRYYGIPGDFIPKVVPTFSIQCELTSTASRQLGLPQGIPVTYRAGDQSNNAFSLGVLEPGEVAATAGTSGVIYGVARQKKYEEKSRVNTFLHVNHDKVNPHYGVLLCINGTGILNSWLKHNFLSDTKDISYSQMDALAAKAPIGSAGLTILPFGNGAERILGNKNVGCRMTNIQFNSHSQSHILRAAQEGIVFSFIYGLAIMKKVGVRATKIKAGFANMFLSPLFGQTLATMAGTTVELYQTDGSCGAARAAGYAVGIYKNAKDAFIGLEKVKTITPNNRIAKAYREAYTRWLDNLNSILSASNSY